MTDADSISIRVARPDHEEREVVTSPPKRRAPTKKRHTVAKVLTSTTIIMALVVGLGVAYFYRHLNGNLVAGTALDDLGSRPEEVVVTGPTKPLNILVMGSDSRDGEGNNIDGLTESGARSDTTILLHVSANRKRAYGISIPRDSMVNRPECRTKDGTIPAADYSQWNAAYSIGGAKCTIQQFESLTGVRLQHYVVVDFNGFKDMVDAINGVQVCIPEAIDDPVGNIQLDAGTQNLRGNAALNYVRERHSVGDGSDIGRVKRQQAFIASMANKIVSADTLARPDRLLRFLNAATSSLEVDKKLASVTKLTELGMQFQDTGLNKIQFITIPWGTDPVDPNRIVWTPEAAEIWRHIARDEPLPTRLKPDVIKADNPSGSSSGSASADPQQALKDQEAADQALRNGLCA